MGPDSQLIPKKYNKEVIRILDKYVYLRARKLLRVIFIYKTKLFFNIEQYHEI